MTIHHDQPLDLGTSSTSTSTSSGRRSPRAAVRWALVERVRLQIAAGQYATPERWDATVDRMARIFAA